MKQLQTKLPTYLVEHTNNKIKEFNNIKSVDASFMFITDFHTLYNSMYSPLVAKEFGKGTSCKLLFNGGDFPFAFGSKEECVEDTRIAVEACAVVKPDVDLYIFRGNHDTTIRKSWEENTGVTFSYDFTRELILNQNSAGMRPYKDKMYFYVDDEQNKVRYICIDTSDAPELSEDTPWGVATGFSEEQQIWLCNSLDVEADWSVVVFGHISVEKEVKGVDAPLYKIADILKAYKNKRKCEYADFTNYKGEFVAYICGHHHIDASVVVDNTLFVLTGCDTMFPDDVWERKEGTISEVLFDVFTIDKSTKTLTAIRIGAGENRTFSY